MVCNRHLSVVLGAYPWMIMMGGMAAVGILGLGGAKAIHAAGIDTAGVAVLGVASVMPR